MVLATVLTVAALPFLWSAKRDQAAGSVGSIAAIAPAGALAGGVMLGPPAEERSPELIEPAFLGGSIETVAPQPLRYDIAAAPTGQVAVGKASYRRWPTGSGATEHPCQTSLAPFNTRIVVTNTDNGYKVACTNLSTKPLDPDLVLVLDTDTFVLLADLTESPIPVELSW